MRSVNTLEKGSAATPLSRDAVDRILESVGTVGPVVPDDINKDELASDLNVALSLFQAIEQKRGRKHRLARKKFAKGIGERADWLLKALDDPDLGYLLWETLPRWDNDDLYIRRAANYDAPSIESLIHALTWLKKAADPILDPPPYKPPYNKWVWTPDATAARRLVAEFLPAIYKKHFGRFPGRSRNAISRKVGGPYVRFVQAVAIEFGTTISPETVDAYLKR